ncbi:Rho termination factor N-terminal domain-containing protein [Lysinibacillus xylanilyticus]|uniref:Rho termination factor N-terminal domain-containing protein n=1 Tax=Lysinibacillus xylanilyticus TaxID=582475 RepID=UPI003CFC222A
MLRAKHGIRHNDVEYKKGAIIDGLTDSEEQRLVRLKSAEYVITPEEEMKKQQVAKDVEVIPPDVFEELRLALDQEYNAEELKREAKEVGVDLTGLTRKDDIIEAIIKQGKADELLEDDHNE